MKYWNKGTRSTQRMLVSCIGLLLVLALLAACNDTTTVKPTPTALPIQFTALNLGIPQVALNAPVTGNVPDSQILHVGVSFKLNQDTLNKLKQLKAKKGTNTDVTGVANQLGITDQEYQHIKSYFGIENATLTLNKLHTYMNVDAKASTFAKVLQTRFVMHKLNNKTFFTPDPAMPPKLPTVIASQILTVTGLDNYGTQQKIGSAFAPAVSSLPHVMQRATQSSTHSTHTTSRKAAADCAVDPNTLSMQQIAHAYGYDSYWQQGFHGENMTVNLVEIDGFNPDDVANYFSCFNVPQNNLKVISVDGAPASAQGETNLDIDMIAGLAPAAMINDYQVGQPTSNDINDALQQIINDNANNTNTASVVSISLGAAENGTDPSMLTAIDSSLQQLTQVEHMTVFIATGDCAAFADGNYNDLSVNFPASDPYAVAVGGTQLQVDGNGNRSQEVVWSNGTDQSTCNNQWGSGGGVSAAFAQPQWQKGNGVNNQYSTGKRQMPDVSAVAYAIAVYQDGQWTGNGGTSAATPIWAAGMLLTNQAIEQKTSGTFVYGPNVFYAVADNAGNAQPFFDVTQGNNLFYSATPGWDDATGIGTPNLVDFGNIVYNLIQQQGQSQ